MANLLSIGTFARAAGLPPSALRYYDEIGLLPAAHVDPANSYRYYDPEQQAQARLIATLRTLGIGVNDMRVILASHGEQRAAHLERLASSIINDATCTANQLRALSAANSSAPAQVTITVDGTALADSLRHAARLTGQKPLDAIMLTTAPGQVRCLATDKYRLADFLTPAQVDGNLTRALLVDHVEVAASLLQALGSRAVLTVGHQLAIGGATLPLQSTQAFPDLASLSDAYQRDARTPVPVDDTWTACRAPVITVPVGDRTVRFTTHLLVESATNLSGGRLMIAVTDPHSPTVLSRQGQPDKRIILMPRTPSCSEDGQGK